MSQLVPFQDMQHMAEAIAASGLFGMKDKNSVLALMAVAQAEGLHPATAARDFHIIQGRPALKADAMLARFQNAGGSVEWKEYTDERVTGVFSHPNGGSLAVTWTIDQASRIGLVKPGSGWQKFPRAMLRSRCISEGIRSVFPGSVTGFYSPEEVQDFEPRQIKDITPIAHEIIEPPHEEVKTGHPLMLPNKDEPHAYFESLDDWQEEYARLYKQVMDNAKLGNDDKAAKISALRDANKPFMSSWDQMEIGKLNQRIAKGRQ